MRIPEQLRFNLSLALIIFLLFLAAKYLLPIFSPFLLGLLIAYLIEKPVSMLGRYFGFPRKFAVILVLLLTLILMGLCLTLLFARLYQETMELLIALPGWVTRFSNSLERVREEITVRLQWPAGFWDHSQLWVDNLRKSLIQLLQRALNLFKGFPVFLFNLFLSGFTAFFLSRDRTKIKQWFLACFPVDWRRTILELHRQALVSGWRFLKTQLLLAMVTGLLSTLGLGLFGFAKPWSAGFVLGICDFLPLVGPALIYLPWIGWELAMGNLPNVIYLALTFLLTLGIRQLIEIRLVGTGLGIHPLLVLISLYVGVKCLGFYGFFLGPIFCVLIRSLYNGVNLFTNNKGFCFIEGDQS